jgi:integrase/recombinase XerD
MNQTTSLIGPLLQAFFTEHLLAHKRASPQTMAAYRDAFRLLLQFVRDNQGIEPSALRVSDLDAPLILAFLDHLEQHRHNSARSRNARLAALRSFFRLVALHDPCSVGVVTRVMAIPLKRVDKRLVGYLTRPEIEALLDAPDRRQWIGRRDQALLLTYYNSGARLSELTTLRQNQVNFGASAFLNLMGKGRKQRTVPLWPKTARVLQAWFRELEKLRTEWAFPNVRGSALSSDGVNYILQQAVRRAAMTCPSLRGKHVTPHMLRHTTAMHLLQSGVDMAVIALWLGHESMETTHIYVEADLAMKEQALQKLAPAGGDAPRFKADDELLAFLATI